MVTPFDFLSPLQSILPQRPYMSLSYFFFPLTPTIFLGFSLLYSLTRSTTSVVHRLARKAARVSLVATLSTNASYCPTPLENLATPSDPRDSTRPSFSRIASQRAITTFCAATAAAVLGPLRVEALSPPTHHLLFAATHCLSYCAVPIHFIFSFRHHHYRPTANPLTRVLFRPEKLLCRKAFVRWRAGRGERRYTETISVWWKTPDKNRDELQLIVLQLASRMLAMEQHQVLIVLLIPDQKDSTFTAVRQIDKIVKMLLPINGREV